MNRFLKNEMIKKTAITFGVFAFSMSMSINTFAQEGEFDPRVKPAPLDEVKFEFPDYEEYKLSNGLKLFVVEDNEAPIVEFRLLLPGGDAFDMIPGQAGFLSSLLTKGYGNIDARKFADMMDGKGIAIGASSSTESFTISGSSLTAHQDIMWEGLKGILTDPKLPEEELEKLKPQALANLKSQKGNPGSMASKLSKKVIFGNNHPYAQTMDENDVSKIQIDNVKDYFQKYIKPADGSLLVIGDIKAGNIKDKLEKLLSEWSGKAQDLSSIPEADSEPLGVYFIPRPGSVQSSIRYLSPAPKYTDRNREVLHLTSGVISGGFSGRLFKTLREKHSYTYSPTGTLTSYKLFNYLMAGSDVRNEVTDSAVTVIQNEIKDLAQNGPGTTELAIMKKYQIGNYNMAFEDPSFAGYIIQNAYFKGQPADYAKDFTKRKAAFTASEIKKAARKYLLPEKSYLVVVGDPSVRESLKQFGKIYDYNTDIMPESGEDALLKKISDSPEEILKDYINAIGGQDNLDKVSNLQAMGKVSLTMQGNTVKGQIRSYKMKDGRFFKELALPVYEQRALYNGKDLYVSTNGIPRPVIGLEKEGMIIEETLFPVANLTKSDAKLTTLGEQSGKILVKAVMPSGKTQTYYFDAETNLLERYTEIVEAPNGNMEAEFTFMNYKKIGNILLPMNMEIDSPMFSNKIDYEYQFNVEVEDSIFDLKKN